MLNDVELTILSLVSEGARYGSEIEQMIELRGLREWLTVGSASVYYILGRLEQQELLTSSHRNGESGQSKTIYQITDAGRGVVQTAVADLLSQPRALGEDFSLGLANSGILKPAQVYSALVQHHDRLTHQLHAAQESAAQDGENLPEGTRAMYSHGVALMQAELTWLDDFMSVWRVRHAAALEEESHASTDGEGDISQAVTQIHSPTASSDRGKQMQRISRLPKEPPAE
jgi:DNA-binding PadR family transcriptional regulator